MWYVAVAIGLIVVAIILRYTIFSPVPRTITSLVDAERLVDHHIGMANRRLRREAWMLTFVVSQLDLDKRTVSVRIGINYGRRGYPDYAGGFQQMWASAAFAKRALQVEVETFT
jgi:hypothetical protein